MKKIINGKLYNTETAKEIGAWSNSWNRGDFSEFEEYLFQKRTGEFFLYGEGGPMTKYAVSCGSNNWSGGSKIIPLTWEDAREWAEKHLEVEEYEKAFGEVSEDETKSVITISITTSIIEKAKKEAAKEGTSLSKYIENLINCKGDGN